MRCDCCQTILTDYESSIKGTYSGEYLNTCIKCLKEADISYYGNKSLLKSTKETTEDFEEDDEY